MAWIEVHQALRDHRKTIGLSKELNIRPVYVIGHLVSLWLWAVDNAPAGDITSIPADTIASASQWRGNGDRYLQALIDSGWVDKLKRRLLLHSWHNYAGKLVAQRQLTTAARRAGGERRMALLTSNSRKTLAKKAATARWQGSNSGKSQNENNKNPTALSVKCQLDASSHLAQMPATGHYNTLQYIDKKDIIERPPTIDGETWDAYLEIRKKKKAPSTFRALRLILAELESFRLQGGDPNKILETSIMRGWVGVFYKGGNSGTIKGHTRTDAKSYTKPVPFED